MPDETNYADTNLDFPVNVRVYAGVAFLTITQNGMQKKVMTNRQGLRVIVSTIQAALDNPMSNVNGDSRAIRD